MTITRYLIPITMRESANKWALNCGKEVDEVVIMEVKGAGM